MLRWVSLFPDLSINSSLTTLGYSASGIIGATIFSPPEDMTITRLAVPFVSDSGTPPDYRISLQSVGTDGNPSGTLLGGTADAKAVFNTVAWTHATVQWLTLDESVAVSKFEKYARVIDYSSGTIDGSNLSTFNRGMNSVPTSGMHLDGAYDTRFSPSTWTKDTNLTPINGYATASQKYGFPMAAARTTNAFNSSSSPNERGFCFTLPGSGQFRLRGVIPLCTIQAGSSIELTLYAGDGASDTTPIDTASIDTDFFANLTVNSRPLYFPGTPPALDYGSPYRLSFQSGNTSNLTIYTTTVTTADDLGAIIPGGSIYYTTRDGGNWTDSTSMSPIVFFLLIEEVGGAGGGLFLTPSIQGLTGIRSY